MRYTSVTGFSSGGATAMVAPGVAAAAVSAASSAVAWSADSVVTPGA
jgi:hypothetical protein